MTDILFIGGYWDGKMKSFPEPVFEHYQVPEPQPLIFHTDATPIRAIRVSEYRIEKFRAPTREFTFYVELGLTIERAMEKLITGYRP